MNRIACFSLLIVVFLLGETFPVLAQSKKDQILILSNRVDSLNKVIKSKDLYLVETDNQSKKLQEIILTQKNKNLELQRLLDIQIQQTQEYKGSLEKSLDQNQKLNKEIKEITSRHVERNCSEVIGNSVSNYPIRVTGEISGCIGDECEEIPSDSDLHKAILAISEDLSGDGVIGVNDLNLAAIKAGDSNSDGFVDIYDLAYPRVIKRTNLISNLSIVEADSKSTYDLTGTISANGDRVVFNTPIEISFLNPANGIKDTERRKELFIVSSSDVIVYRNKRVVLRGELSSGISQSYKDFFLFNVDEIIGIAEDVVSKKLFLGSRELKIGDKINFNDPELYGWKNIDMTTHYVLYRTIDGWEVQIGTSGDRYLKVEFINSP